jgi:hypothetical protein
MFKLVCIYSFRAICLHRYSKHGFALQQRSATQDFQALSEQN